MVFSRSQLTIAACLATAAHAFESITVPAAITAGETFTLTVTTNDADSAYSTYRVYLDTTPPGYTGGPSCYLKNTTSTSTTSVDLTIPADFGPDGDYYSLSTREYPNASGYTSSNSFSMTGATGNWSEYENSLMGSPLWPADDLPCSAYNCARTCATTSYPDDLTYGSDAYNTMANCILDCPGVSLPLASVSSSLSSSAAATAAASSTATDASSSAASATATTSSSSSSSGMTTSTNSASASSGSSGRASSTSASSTAADSASATSSGVVESTGAAFVNSASVAMVAAGGLFALLV